MTKHIKSREVEKRLYTNHLLKAVENYESALKSIKEGAYNASAVSAVHSAISSADAYCVFGIGKRCASKNRKDVVSLIIDASQQKEFNIKIGVKFDSIIRIKNMAEYEERLIKQKKVKKAVREAGELLDLVKKSLKEI
jgi:uncharacterized protein (UPF0332 family)